MPVYMLFIREDPIRDPEAMAEYSRMNRESGGKFAIQPLVVYGAMDAIEGKAPDGIILLKFESREDALAWYNSPEYQSAIPYRQKGADYRAIIVDGIA
jgi:uncharacterized protein (DUF1330 family)